MSQYSVLIQKMYKAAEKAGPYVSGLAQVGEIQQFPLLNDFSTRACHEQWLRWTDNRRC